MVEREDNEKKSSPFLHQSHDTNLQEFFIPVDPLPGQTKGHMKCDPCV